MFSLLLWRILIALWHSLHGNTWYAVVLLKPFSFSYYVQFSSFHFNWDLLVNTPAMVDKRTNGIAHTPAIRLSGRHGNAGSTELPLCVSVPLVYSCLFYSEYFVCSWVSVIVLHLLHIGLYVARILRSSPPRVCYMPPSSNPSPLLHSNISSQGPLYYSLLKYELNQCGSAHGSVIGLFKALLL